MSRGPVDSAIVSVDSRHHPPAAIRDGAIREQPLDRKGPHLQRIGTSARAARGTVVEK